MVSAFHCRKKCFSRERDYRASNGLWPRKRQYAGENEGLWWSRAVSASIPVSWLGEKEKFFISALLSYGRLGRGEEL